jgi:hypothetical protein
MLKPSFITFTGVDERTDWQRVQALSDRYPVEWAALFSRDRQGRERRYPSAACIGAFRALPVTKAAHVCGCYAKAVMAWSQVDLDLTGFDRIQVNHSKPEAGAIRAFAQEWGAKGIMQTRTLEFPYGQRVAQLFDRSGGRGEYPSRWPTHPGNGRLVGYAGGIGPDNVLDTLRAIVATGPYWIDMESGVRTDDWLDLDKCEAVLRAVYGKAVPR